MRYRRSQHPAAPGLSEEERWKFLEALEERAANRERSRFARRSTIKSMVVQLAGTDTRQYTEGEGRAAKKRRVTHTLRWFAAEGSAGKHDSTSVTKLVDDTNATVSKLSLRHRKTAVDA